jgi:pyridinium-3,5-biscarboxylic acid mononucleotide sulfurtransferase
VIDPHKQTILENVIKSLGSVVVAFSGGADSTLLLAVSVRVLDPERVLAVTADSPTLPRSELRDATALAAELGAQHLVVATNELGDRDFVGNSPDRCYFCKRDLFATLRQVADGRGFHHLLLGATADDLGDYRPGLRAAKEAGATAPLLEAGFTKADVRELSRQLGLRTWDKPAAACLSSRVPYGTPITASTLAQVEQAEELLRCGLGLRQVRVRHHGPVARIEVGRNDLPRLFEEPIRQWVDANLKQLGYTYVAVDLEGFRSGSMNEVLVEKSTHSA